MLGCKQGDRGPAGVGRGGDGKVRVSKGASQGAETVPLCLEGELEAQREGLSPGERV